MSDTIPNWYICERCGAETEIHYGPGIKCPACGSEFCRKKRLSDLPNSSQEADAPAIVG